jgi:hypothetical protein
MFILTGIIYCAEMMIAFKDESDEMIASYWRRIDSTSFDENQDLNGKDEASVQRHAKRFFHTAHGILTAAAVFIVLALITSARVMGLKYTLKRVGTGVNFAGIIFGLFLLVMCGVVSRTTYHVSDAITVDVEVTFAQDREGPPPRAARDFEDMLRVAPERIFRDAQPPPPGGSRGTGSLDTSPPIPPPPPPTNTTNTTSPPPPTNTTNTTSPPPPPPPPSPLLPSPPSPPPPWSGDFPVQSMWLVNVDRTQPYPPVSTLVEFTISFSGMNASTDINATLPLAVESRIRRAVAALPTAPDPRDLDVEVMNMRLGGQHPIGGAWTAQLLAAAGAITVISSTAGFVGIQAGSRPMLTMHLVISGVTAILVIVGVHHVTQHADDSKDYIRSHWKDIQTGVVGDNVEVDDAAAFANSHMRSAAALGAVVCTILFISILCSTVALLVIPGGPLASAMGYNRPRPGTARAARQPDSESDDDDDDSEEEGWGAGWDSWGDEDDDSTPLRNDEGNLQRRNKSRKRAKRDTKRLAAKAAKNGSANQTAAGPGQVVVEMSDLANLVQEARKGRGRFKERGGKSSRTPSPTGHDVENPPSRESSPQRKARLQRERARRVKDSSVSKTVSRLEDKLVDRMGALFGGIASPKAAAGGGSNGEGGGRAGTSVFRDEISKPNYSQSEIAAAVNMLREAAQRRNPNDPEAALRAALEVAGEGDAGLIREALAAPFEVSKPHVGASFTLE